MKKLPFDLEKAKAGAKLVTRDGRLARIICYDCKIKKYPLVTLIQNNNEEYSTHHTIDGKYVYDMDGESDYDLFILEEPTFRPYANAEEFLKDMREHWLILKKKDDERYCLIVTFDESGIRIIDDYWYTYEQLKDLYTWEDGSPCGVMEGGEDD